MSDDSFWTYCPACEYGPQWIDDMRCAHCKSVIVREGEEFENELGDRVFLWTGLVWAEEVGDEPPLGSIILPRGFKDEPLL